jgi:hypothetical protein
MCAKTKSQNRVVELAKIAIAAFKINFLAKFFRDSSLRKDKVGSKNPLSGQTCPSANT